MLERQVVTLEQHATALDTGLISLHVLLYIVCFSFVVCYLQRYQRPVHRTCRLKAFEVHAYSHVPEGKFPTFFLLLSEPLTTIGLAPNLESSGDFLFDNVNYLNIVTN